MKTALLLVLDLTVVIGEATLQDCASDLLTLPEINQRKTLIAMAVNRLSGTTDFGLGL